MMVCGNAHAKKGSRERQYNVERRGRGRGARPEVAKRADDALVNALAKLRNGAPRPAKSDQHCHETMQPFVNHLTNVSRSISRVLHHARPPTNQWLFNCSIQCTTSRRRSNGDFTGRSFAFSVSSIGRACGGFKGGLDQRLRMDVRACAPEQSSRKEREKKC
jgi:hypothetical protein